MKTLIEIAVENLNKRGYKANEANTIGFISIIDPAYVITKRPIIIHHLDVWKFINERSGFCRLILNGGNHV
jgi:hypothetical protein